MNLQSTIRIYAGGPGSGCTGPNCGRKSTGRINWEVPKYQRKFASRLDVKLMTIPAHKLTASETFNPNSLDTSILRKLYQNAAIGHKSIPPILVIPKKGKFEVQDGHHRARLGMIIDKAVRAYVVTSDAALASYNRAAGAE